MPEPLRGPEPVPTYRALAVTPGKRLSRPTTLASCAVCGLAFWPCAARLETCCAWCIQTLLRWREVAAAERDAFWREP
jgi:hypothetical protein